MNTPHDDPRQLRVAVIGTGTMGGAIASRLLHMGFEVSVWSRNPVPIHAAVEHGATAFADATDAVEKADVVITMLPTKSAIQAVMFDAKALDAMEPNATWVQMATIGVRATRELASDTEARRPDVVFVDAPVSGSKEPAESGQLLILASGPDEAGRLLDRVFDIIGKRTMWLGSTGAGSAMKLVLNTWLAFQTGGCRRVSCTRREPRCGPRAPSERTDRQPAGLRLRACQAQEDAR